MAQHFVAKSVSSAIIATLMVTTSVERATAGGAEAALGALGLLMLNEISRGKPRPKPGYKPGMSAAQRQQNRDVQHALNAFAFPVGVADGVLGKRSRAAIGDYQAYMGYARTGQLTEAERNMLIGGWQAFQRGEGSAYPAMMAAVGPRGMLNAQRDPGFPARFGDRAGGSYDLDGTWDNEPFLPQPERQADGLIPDLQARDQASTSAAARCELVVQTTRIQGGVVPAVNMTNPDQALSEKFCDARSFAITQSGSVAAGFQVSDAELEVHCQSITTGLQSVVAALPDTQPAQVARMAQTAGASRGLSDQTMTMTYGQICLGLGYRLDNAEMALAGALVMMGTGAEPYAEVVGHHLREGFGVPAAPAAAVHYYTSAITALQEGATAAFEPSTTPERVQVIRAALQLSAQRAATGGVRPATLAPVNATLTPLAPVQH